MSKTIITSEPQYQGCWLSYCGAVAGALQALGLTVDVVDVAGYSGYTFLTNVTQGWTDPGSPTLHSGNVELTIPSVLDLWAEIIRGTEALGVKIDHFWDPRQFRVWRQPLDSETLSRARGLFEHINAEIDRGQPVVVWGLVVPEYGIVKGYEGDHYLVSTFRSDIGQPEVPVKYDELQAKGGLEALFFREATKGPTAEDDKNAVTRAISMAEGTPYRFEFSTPRHPVREHQRYITGPAAFDEWASVLEESRPGTVYYEYNSYVAACIQEAKRLAARFTQRLLEKHAGRSQVQSLAQAAEAYNQAEALMTRFVTLFPYADTGEMPLEKCRKGASVLRAVKPHELEALGHLREASEVWD